MTVTDSGGWSSRGPLESAQITGAFLPSDWLTPEFGSLVCKEGAGCDSDMKPPAHRPPQPPLPPLIGSGGGTEDPNNDAYGHNDPLPAQPPSGPNADPSGGRRSDGLVDFRGADVVPLSFDMPAVVSVGSVSLTHVNNLMAISLPQATTVCALLAARSLFSSFCSPAQHLA